MGSACLLYSNFNKEVNDTLIINTQVVMLISFYIVKKQLLIIKNKMSLRRQYEKGTTYTDGDVDGI